MFRFKKIVYDAANWDFIDVPNSLEPAARKWFEDHEGEKYDVLGNVHFLVPLVGDEKRKWCCSEALAEALGIREAWRFHPNSLAAIFRSISITKD